MHPLLLADAPAGTAEPALLTREVFGNIPRGSQLAFYLFASVAMLVFGYGLWRHIRLWRRGKSRPRPIAWKAGCRRFFQDVLGQRRIWGRPLASLAHALLFTGFVVLLIGTTLIAIEHLLAAAVGRTPTDPLFHKGFYYGVYELTMDAAGIALVVGCALFGIRQVRGQNSFAHNWVDGAVLLLLATIGLSGFAVEGLRILAAGTPLPGLSPVGYVLARLSSDSGMTAAAAAEVHFWLWWGHAWMALGFIAWMPYTRLLHGLAGTLNLTVRDHRLGFINAIDLEEVEATGTLGVGVLEDFTWSQLVELDACVSCGRCEDACPAFEAGKPLSPREVVQGIARHAHTLPGSQPAALHGDTITAETLWSCTTCTSCEDVCPLGISPVQMITDMRRHLILEGGLRGPPATALGKSQRIGNPWGLPAADRLQWAEGLDVPTVDERPDFEILYWVGCAAAYDRRTQKVARSFVKLLHAAGVKFAVLGAAEKCTGEAARRMGDELLFQELGSQNVANLQAHQVTQIVSHCPHCVNSLRQDYPQIGGNFRVQHHSELLTHLLDTGRLQTAPSDTSQSRKITYHDPCYLARAQGVVDEPRQVLAAACGSSPDAHEPALTELPRHGRNTACCGGGGGRMWFDDPPEERIGRGRIDELLDSNASTVAVSCPFCLTMLSDGVAARDANVQVRDIAEVLADSL